MQKLLADQCFTLRQDWRRGVLVSGVNIVFVWSASGLLAVLELWQILWNLH